MKSKKQNWWKDPKVSEIIKLDLEITEAIIKGHKSTEDDCFKKYRTKLKKLRDKTGITKLSLDRIKK